MLEAEDFAIDHANHIATRPCVAPHSTFHLTRVNHTLTMYDTHLRERNITKYLKQMHKITTLTEKDLGAEPATDISYSQSGTYSPYKRTV